jgi:hypothetical protein
MARRESGAQLMIRAAAKMPWWLCLLLAAFSYFALHTYAAEGPERPPDIQTAVRTGYVYAFAAVGQYALPTVFMFGAILSGIAASKRERKRPDIEGTVTCPRCGRQMIGRVARNGPKAGSAFWGCASYPTCQGTRDV